MMKTTQKKRFLVLLVVVLVLLLVVSETDANKKRKKEKKKKKSRNKDVVTSWCVGTKKMHKKKGIQLTCKGGQLASLSMLGLTKEGDCAGLTASLFVQMNSCLWKESCAVKKRKEDKYMIKLYRGNAAQCITKSFKQFKITYLCTKPQVPVLDVLSGVAQEVSETRGIVRSHADHPWLYRGHSYTSGSSGGGGGVKLVLQRPKDATTHFVYTIHSLKLMHKDELKVSADNNIPAKYRHDVTNRPTHVLHGAHNVTFELMTSPYSTGAEGFVICFEWREDENKADACSALLSPGKKSSRMRKCKKKRN